MSQNFSWAERRQFGRRPLNASAVAELPGPVEVPCVIENISEGGALLSFPTGIAPIDRFDLVIDDFSRRVPCEMRHQVGIRFGIRFRRQDVGEALVRHFFPAATVNAPAGAIERTTDARKEVQSCSGRDLRIALLPLLVGEASQPSCDGQVAHQPPAPPAVEREPSDGILPPNLQAATSHAMPSRPPRLLAKARRSEG